MTYCFDSQIPKGATPTFYDIREFGKVPYNNMKWTSAFDGFTNFHQSCSQVSIGDPFYFSVCNFKWDTTFHPAHDLITADLSIISADPTKNTVVNLNYLPLSERGIVGAVYTDTFDCKPSLTVGPSMTKKSQICVIVPKGEKNIKIIFTGDVNTVYDTGF